MTSRIRRIGVLTVAPLLAWAGVGLQTTASAGTGGIEPAIIGLRSQSGSFTKAADGTAAVVLKLRGKGSFDAKGDRAGIVSLPADRGFGLLRTTDGFDAVVRVPGAPQDENAIAMRVTGTETDGRGIVTLRGTVLDAPPSTLRRAGKGIDAALPAVFSGAAVSALDPDTTVKADQPQPPKSNVSGGYDVYVKFESSFPAGATWVVTPRSSDSSHCAEVPASTSTKQDKSPWSGKVVTFKAVTDGWCSVDQTSVDLEINLTDAPGLAVQMYLGVNQIAPATYTGSCSRHRGTSCVVLFGINSITVWADG